MEYERHASLSIPAKPGFVGLARLALAAVCRLAPLGPAEIADLKLAITEAAVSLMGGREDGRVEFDFRLQDDRLELEIRGPGEPADTAEDPAVTAAILDATADEVSREPGRVQLVKLLAPATEARAVLNTVGVGHKSLADYTHLVGRPLVAEIRELAEPLRGRRILHLSATAFGGGVSEILYTLVPLMRDIGLEAEWQVILGREEFFNATKRMHNALQGAPHDLTPAEWEIWERYNELNARELSDGWDTVIVHDPQPAAVREHVPDRARHWIWRCHIDLSTPNPDTVGRVVPHLTAYDGSVFHRAEYVPSVLATNGRPVHIVPPAIDPLSPKNMALSPEDAAYVCDQFGIDVDRPLMCQVSRFDPWKDPNGVIDAYRAVNEEMPEVQLALIGSMATDDPEGWEFFNSTVEHAAGDPDIHILNNLNNVGAIEVNAFQSQADVLIQKSTREGFGLTVSEALWKARPTVAGAVGGIPLQIEDGRTGYLVDSAEECAERSLRILRSPEHGKDLGRAGKELVRERFLTPRLLRDWLKILGGL